MRHFAINRIANGNKARETIFDGVIGAFGQCRTVFDSFPHIHRLRSVDGTILFRQIGARAFGRNLNIGLRRIFVLFQAALLRQCSQRKFIAIDGQCVDVVRRRIDNRGQQVVRRAQCLQLLAVREIQLRELVVRQVDGNQVVGIRKVDGYHRVAVGKTDFRQVVVADVQMAYGQHIVQGQVRQLVVADIDIFQQIFTEIGTCARQRQGRKIVFAQIERMEQAVFAQIDGVQAGISQVQLFESHQFGQVDSIQRHIVHAKCRHRHALGHIHREDVRRFCIHIRCNRQMRCRNLDGVERVGIAELQVALFRIFGRGTGQAYREFQRFVGRTHIHAERFVGRAKLFGGLHFEVAGIEHRFREFVVDERNDQTVGVRFFERYFAVGIFEIVLVEQGQCIGVQLRNAVQRRCGGGAFAQHLAAEVQFRTFDIRQFGRYHARLVKVFAPIAGVERQRGKIQIVVVDMHKHKVRVGRQIEFRQVVFVGIQRLQQRTFRHIEFREVIGRAEQVNQIRIIRQVEFIQFRTDIISARLVCAVELLQLGVVAHVDAADARIADIQNQQIGVLAHIQRFDIRQIERQAQQVRALGRVDVRYTKIVIRIERLHLRIFRQVELGAIEVVDLGNFEQHQLGFVAYHQRRLGAERVVGQIQRAQFAVVRQVQRFQQIVLHAQNLQISQLRQVDALDVAAIEVQIVDFRRIAIEFHHAGTRHSTRNERTFQTLRIFAKYRFADFPFRFAETAIHRDIDRIGGGNRYCERVLRTGRLVQRGAKCQKRLSGFRLSQQQQRTAQQYDCHCHSLRQFVKKMFHV